MEGTNKKLRVFSNIGLDKNLKIKSILNRSLFLLRHPTSIFIAISILLFSKYRRRKYVFLRSDRLGHFCTNTELFRCRMLEGIIPSTSSYFFFFQEKIANSFIKKIWEEKLPVVKHNLPYIGAKMIVNHLFRHNNYFIDIRYGTDYSRDIEGLFEKYSPPYSFNDAELLKGKDYLMKIGVSDNTPFVCIHARDDVYLNSYEKPVSSSYHDYRDFSIHDYNKAILELINRGYVIIRMGSVVKEPLNINHPMVIDYSLSEYQSDFLDVFLISQCAFFISSDTGINDIANLFRKERCVINQISVNYLTSYWKYPIIFKKIRRIQDGKLLSLREIFESGAAGFLRKEQFEQEGLIWINNSPEEICDLAIEMDERINGRWVETPDDELLQKKFWEIFQNFADPSLHKVYRARIGTEFLRHNQYLLE